MPAHLTYRIDIAPLVILPLKRSPIFSYLHTETVPRGSVVSVSFGKQSVLGVVFESQPFPGRPPRWYKPLSRVLDLPPLTEKQLLLAQYISEEYFTPLGKVLRHFIPKKIKSRTKTKAITTTRRASVRPSIQERLLLERFFKDSKQRPYFLDTTTVPDSKHFFALLANALHAQKKQTLILVPEIVLIPGMVAYCQKYFPETSRAVLHSKLSSGALTAAWENIRSGTASLIIATRQGLFAPYQDLGAIIVTEEQDESYKQWDMSPRYHTKNVATTLSQLSRACLLLTSGTPSLESLHALNEKKLIPLGTIAEEAEDASVGEQLTIVNLRLERYRKNFSPLSKELTTLLETTLAQKKQALLYINRQGLSAFSVCADCKNVLRCPECHYPLKQTSQGSFHCQYCGYTTGLFPSCPECGHLSFRHIGFGTERVEKEVRRSFPQARVLRLDGSTLKNTTTLTATYEKLRSGEIDILIGTQMILKDPTLPLLGLVAMIDADSMLLFPDFRADERFFQDITRAVRQVGKQHGFVVVQTFRPESPILKRVGTEKKSVFQEALLTEREALSYPPFFRFTALICEGKNAKEALRMASTVEKKLSSHLPKDYRLSAPSTPRFLKKSLLFETEMLLRFPAAKTLDTSLRKHLIALSSLCTLDVDPFSSR